MIVCDALQVALGKGLDRLDAQMLLLHALQKSSHDRAWLMSHSTDELGHVQQATFHHLIQQRLEGKPVAYITGEKEFFGLHLAVTPDVLVPRPDTETLVQWALDLLPTEQTASVLDLGTGSGAIGLAIKANRPNASVTLVDASQAALGVACANGAKLGLAVRSVCSNWLDGLSSDSRFNLIVSNPPYIAQGDPHLAALQHEPILALTSGADGLTALKRIAGDAPRYLVRGGWLLLEHGYDQAGVVQALLRAQGFEQVNSQPDLAGILRCTGGRLPL